MKTLKCEMCGSVDLVKQDGLFVCQYCGTKYSVEEAKKMMVEVEGTVEVQGTVQIDNSSYVEKYLANARRAKAKEDWAEAEKYYNMVEQNDPTNIEAIFYSAFGKAKMSLLDADRFKRENAFSVLSNCISIIDDNFKVNEEGDNREIVQQIYNDIIAIRGASFVYNTSTYNGITTNDAGYTYNMFDKMTLVFCETLENIVKKVDGAEVKAKYYYMALGLTKQILNGVKTGYRKTAKSFADRYATVLLQLDPQGMEALLAKEKREQEAKIERIKNNKPNKVLSLLSLVFMSISLILTIIAFVILNKAFHNEDDDVFYLWQTPRVFAIITLCLVVVTFPFSIFNYTNRIGRVVPVLLATFALISMCFSLFSSMFVIVNYNNSAIFGLISFILQFTVGVFACILYGKRK